MDPEGPDIANAFGIAVFLLPLDLGGIACVIHLLNNMRKKLIAALARQSVEKNGNEINGLEGELGVVNPETFHI
jgi:hypothetical protein